MGASSDADLEADTVLSPEHPVRLWGRSTRSGRSSCLSSRANSNLTLTDTEHENTETGEWLTWPVGYPGYQDTVLIIILISCSITGALVKLMKNGFALSEQKSEPFAMSHEIPTHQ